MSFWPKKITIQEVLINSIGSLIAWLIWSIIIAIIIFSLSNIVDVIWEFSNLDKVWKSETTTIFPLILSLVTLVWTWTTMFLTYFLLTVTNPEKYKKSVIIIGQIAFFLVILYVLITPVYIILWLRSYELIMYVFLFHTIILTFGISIILEVLNNYRYVLIWIYWSFLWLFASIVLTVLIYFSFTSWYAKLISLVIILPLVNLFMTFFKQIFELLYYKYHKYTALDQLWDIFYQIELDEKEELRAEEERNIL